MTDPAHLATLANLIQQHENLDRDAAEVEAHKLLCKGLGLLLRYEARKQPGTYWELKSRANLRRIELYRQRMAA